MSGSQDIAALFVNRFEVAMSEDITRIAFGEAIVGTDATWRAAVVMRMADVIALADLLKTLSSGKSQQPTKN